MNVRMEHKAAGAALDGGAGGVVATLNRYRHRIIGSVTGVVDEVGDIVEPGAYGATLKRRRPKIIKDHDWKTRLGKTLAVEELPPGHPDLPKETAQGQPWPAEAGALVLDVELFAGTPEGDAAAARWTAEGKEAQFSIGYRVPAGKAARGKDGIRRIKEVDLFEVSDVLWGAMPLAGLLPEELATKMLADAPVADVLLPEDGSGEAEDADGEPAAALPGDVDDDTAVDVEDGLATVTVDDLAAVDAEDLTEEDLDDAVEVATEAVDGLDDEDDEADNESPVLLSPLDDGPDGEDGADLDDEVKAAFLAGALPRTPASTSAGLETKRDVSTGKRKAMAKRGTAMPDGSFPISNADDLKNAIRAAGRAKDQAAARKHIIARARALKLSFLIPDGWANGKGLDDDLDLEGKYDTSPVGTPGGRQNWVDKTGGLPPFIRAIAHALIRNGHPKARAIAIAVGTVKRWAGGGGKVSAKTRAKAADALAQWEKMKGESHAGKSHTGGWDPSLEVGPWAAHTPATGILEAKAYVELAGTVEARLRAVRAAVCDAMGATVDGDPDGDSDGPPVWVHVEGTYDDRVIVCRTDPRADPEGQPQQRQVFEVDYLLTPDGDVVLGEARPVQLAVTVIAGDDPSADVADAVDDVTNLATKLTTGETVEGKAGRVLSGMNTTRLRDAVKNLIAVLAAAGVDLGDLTTPAGPGQPARPMPPAQPVPTEGKDLTSLWDLPDPHAFAAMLRAAAVGD